MLFPRQGKHWSGIQWEGDLVWHHSSSPLSVPERGYGIDADLRDRWLEVSKFIDISTWFCQAKNILSGKMFEMVRSTCRSCSFQKNMGLSKSRILCRLSVHFPALITKLLQCTQISPVFSRSGSPTACGARPEGFVMAAWWNWATTGHGRWYWPVSGTSATQGFHLHFHLWNHPKFDKSNWLSKGTPVSPVFKKNTRHFSGSSDVPKPSQNRLPLTRRRPGFSAFVGAPATGLRGSTWWRPNGSNVEDMEDPPWTSDDPLRTRVLVAMFDFQSVTARVLRACNSLEGMMTWSRRYVQNVAKCLSFWVQFCVPLLHVVLIRMKTTDPKNGFGKICSCFKTPFACVPCSQIPGRYTLQLFDIEWLSPMWKSPSITLPPHGRNRRSFPSAPTPVCWSLKPHRRLHLCDVPQGNLNYTVDTVMRWSHHQSFQNP